MYLHKSTRAYILVILFLLCGLITGCVQKQPKPETTIQELQTAINQYDLQGILNCVADNQAQLLMAVATISGIDSAVESTKWIKILKTLMPAVSAICDDAALSMPTISIEPLRSEVLADDAKVDVSCVITWGETSHCFETTFKMKTEDNRWVICGLN